MGKADGPYKRVRGGLLAAIGRPYGSNEAGGACGLLAAIGRPYGWVRTGNADGTAFF